MKNISIIVLMFMVNVLCLSASGSIISKDGKTKIVYSKNESGCLNFSVNRGTKVVYSYSGNVDFVKMEAVFFDGNRDGFQDVCIKLKDEGGCEYMFLYSDKSSGLLKMAMPSLYTVSDNGSRGGQEGMKLIWDNKMVVKIVFKNVMYNSVLKSEMVATYVRDRDVFVLR